MGRATADRLRADSRDVTIVISLEPDTEPTAAALAALATSMEDRADVIVRDDHRTDVRDDHRDDGPLPLGTDEVQALAAVLARPAGVASDDLDEDGLFEPTADFDPGLEPAFGLPRQRDEFTCNACYLVAHVSRQASPGRCQDCA